MLDEVEKYIIIFHEGNIMKGIHNGVGKSFNKCFLIRQTISKGLKEKFFKITIDYYLPLFSQLINLVVSNTYHNLRLFFKFLRIEHIWKIEVFVRFMENLFLKFSVTNLKGGIIKNELE